MNYLSNAARQNYKQGLAELIEAQRANLALTLAFNADGQPRSIIEPQVKTFIRDVNRALLGSAYSRKKDQQLQGIFIIEKAKTNGHVHGCCYIDQSFLEHDVKSILMRIKLTEGWERFTKYRGTIDIKEIYDEGGWAKYIAKEFRYSKDFDDYFFAGGHHA